MRAWQALAVLSKFAPADDVKNTFRTIWSSLQVPLSLPALGMSCEVSHACQQLHAYHAAIEYGICSGLAAHV